MINIGRKHNFCCCYGYIIAALIPIFRIAAIGLLLMLKLDHE